MGVGAARLQHRHVRRHRPVRAAVPTRQRVLGRARPAGGGAWPAGDARRGGQRDGRRRWQLRRDGDGQRVQRGAGQRDGLLCEAAGVHGLRLHRHALLTADTHH